MTAGTLLAISTGSAALSVAAFREGGLAAYSHELIGRGHAEALIGTVADVMARAGLASADAIVVDLGPGSFTGVRIGVAAARALGLAWGAPVTGCEAAALVAAHVFHGRPELADVIVSIDAGRGQHYRQQRFPDGTGGPVAIIAATGEPDIPDARNAVSVPVPARSLAPAPVYIRPPDAVLPL